MAMDIPPSALGCQDPCLWATTGIWEMEAAGCPAEAAVVAHHRTCLRCGVSRLVPVVEGGGAPEIGCRIGSAATPARAASG